ncbi:hypothetical protein FRC03_000181 [Tulasnella sp. 419]|nr:hypothetical protein FRC03_000181 [Tulasnella sp. 419]
MGRQRNAEKREAAKQRAAENKTKAASDETGRTKAKRMHSAPTHKDSFDDLPQEAHSTPYPPGRSKSTRKTRNQGAKVVCLDLSKKPKPASGKVRRSRRHSQAGGDVESDVDGDDPFDFSPLPSGKSLREIEAELDAALQQGLGTGGDHIDESFAATHDEDVLGDDGEWEPEIDDEYEPVQVNPEQENPEQVEYVVALVDIPIGPDYKSFLCSSRRKWEEFIEEVAGYWKCQPEDIALAYRIAVSNEKTSKANPPVFHLVESPLNWAEVWANFRHVSEEQERKNKRLNSAAKRKGEKEPQPPRVSIRMEDGRDPAKKNHVTTTSKNNRTPALAAKDSSTTLLESSSSTSKLKAAKDWMTIIRNSGKFKCAREPNAICVLQDQGDHYHLTLSDMNLWGDLLDGGKATIDSVPEVIQIANYTRQRPAPKRQLTAVSNTAAGSSQSPDHHDFPRPTHESIQVYDAPATSGSSAGSPASSSLRHGDNFINYPRIADWLAELDGDHRGRDGQEWKQYADAFKTAGYYCLDQLVSNNITQLTGEKLAERVGGGLVPGAADQLLTFALDDASRIKKNTRG